MSRHFFTSNFMGAFLSSPKKTPDPAKPTKPSKQGPDFNDNGIKIEVGTFDQEEIKILILGPGESGKSTYWRQLRNLYTGGLSIKEKKLLINPIRINIITDIITIVKAAENMAIPISSTLDFEVNLIKESENELELSPELSDAIKKVWADPSAKVVYDQIHSSQLSDHSAYFLDSVERISQDDYIPDNDDVIKCRIRTTGINNVKFNINGRKVLLVDVGGQKNERTKWQSVFQNVTAIIFVVSLADFDQCMFENAEERRTTDSLELFKSTISKGVFQEKPVFLILNKEDELRKKLQTVPGQFKTAYPNFEGDIKNVSGVIDFIEAQYFKMAPDRAPNAQVTSFVTCAVDPSKLNDSFVLLSEKLINLNQ